MVTEEQPQDLTTSRAFERLLNNRDQWRKTGRPMQQRLGWLDKLKNNINISLDTKEKILQEAGYTILKQTLWISPKRPTSTK